MRAVERPCAPRASLLSARPRPPIVRAMSPHPPRFVIPVRSFADHAAKQRPPLPTALPRPAERPRRPHTGTSAPPYVPPPLPPLSAERLIEVMRTDSDMRQQALEKPDEDRAEAATLHVNDLLRVRICQIDAPGSSQYLVTSRALRLIPLTLGWALATGRRLPHSRVHQEPMADIRSTLPFPPPRSDQGQACASFSLYVPL